MLRWIQRPSQFWGSQTQAPRIADIRRKYGEGMKDLLPRRATRTSGARVATAILLLCSCALLRASHPIPSPAQRSGPAQAGLTLSHEGEIVRGPRGKSEIALTFDAGTTAECFDDLITALENAHVHSTFFITGNWAQRNRDCALAIAMHGHEVGNHTWNHLDLTKQSDEVIREEITRADVLLQELTGQSPRPRWRPPFGARNDRVLRTASSLGYRAISWTIDSLDSADPKKTPEFLINRIIQKSDAELDGAIILMHVGERSTATALPVIISNLQSRGFKLVTVSTLLR